MWAHFHTVEIVYVVLVEKVYILGHVFFSKGFRCQHKLSEQRVRLDSVGSYCYYSFNPWKVFIVVESEKGTHYRCTKGMENEYERFICSVLQFLMQGLSLKLYLSIVHPFFCPFFSNFRFEAFRIYDYLLSRNTKSFILIFKGRQSSEANVQEVFFSQIYRYFLTFVLISWLLNSPKVGLGQCSGQLGRENSF